MPRVAFEPSTQGSSGRRQNGQLDWLSRKNSGLAMVAPICDLRRSSGKIPVRVTWYALPVVSREVGDWFFPELSARFPFFFLPCLFQPSLSVVFGFSPSSYFPCFPFSLFLLPLLHHPLLVCVQGPDHEEALVRPTRLLVVSHSAGDLANNRYIPLSG
jgi:hypothetical protein